jgi:hypothetical protein
MTDSQKLYTIDVTRNDIKTGVVLKRWAMPINPMTHQQACTLISKHTVYTWRGFIVVEYPRTDGLTPELA